MNTLPAALLEHCIFPLLNSKEVGALAQTSLWNHACRNYTTAITDMAELTIKSPCRQYASASTDRDNIVTILNGIKDGASMRYYSHYLAYPYAMQLVAHVPAAQLRREIIQLELKGLV